jgi:hypothetical protein
MVSLQIQDFLQHTLFFLLFSFVLLTSVESTTVEAALANGRWDVHSAVCRRRSGRIGLQQRLLLLLLPRRRETRSGDGSSV